MIFAGAPVCFAETFVLEEIIVQSERLSMNGDSLDIRDITESPARDLGEALDAVEGVSFIRKGGIANDVILRGFNRDNLTMLIDNARIYGACPNRMDPSPFHIDFAEIEKVTVVKGPFDVKNAGSLGGVINAKTLSPHSGLHGKVSGMYGSYENINTAVNGSYGTEKADALLGYSYKYSLPYKDGDGNRITELYPIDSPNRYRPGEENEQAYSINTFWTKLGFKPFAGQRMELSYTRQEADDVIYPYLLMDADYDNTDRVNWTYALTPSNGFINKINFQMYWNNVRHDMTDSKRVSSIGRPLGYSMRTFAETETYGGQAAFESSIGPDDALSFGIDYYMRNWEAETTLPTGTQNSIPDVDQFNIGAFAEYKHPFTEEFQLTVGGRFDHAEAKARENRSELYEVYHGTSDLKADDSFISANVQLLYSYHDSLQLFAGTGLSVRTPDPVERYFALARPMDKPNWVGNPGLDTVKNREIDLGIKYQGEHFHGKLTLFYSNVKDYITVVNIAGSGSAKPARSYRNVDATIYGGEGALEVHLSDAFILKGGIAYTWGNDDTLDEPLAEIPPLEANIALRYDRKQYFAELAGVFADRQDRINLTLQEEETAGWGVANFSAGIEYKHIVLYGSIINILDEQYARHQSYQRDPFRSGIIIPEIGRSFFISLSLRI